MPIESLKISVISIGYFDSKIKLDFSLLGGLYFIRLIYHVWKEIFRRSPKKERRLHFMSLLFFQI